MFQSIVIPLDGSELSARALPYAALVATPGARITLIGAVEPPSYDRFSSSRSQETLDEMSFCREILTHEVEERAVPLRAQGFDVVATVRTGSPVGEIIGCARDEHADLIVITTHGAGGMARWAFGSVTNSVLHNTTVPTLVVRASASDDASVPPRLEGIIAPLDGSPAAEEALPSAETIATRLDLPLQVVRVISDVSSLWDPDPLGDGAAIRRLRTALAHTKSDAKHAVDAIVTRMNGAGVRATGTVLMGDPAAVLSAYLSERPHSLVILASHGEHQPQPWLFGTIAEKLVATAPNPTLVVHPASRVVPFLPADSALAARYPD